MGVRLFATVLGTAVLAGCAARDTDTSLSLDHPANPEAAVASVPSRSTTLQVRPAGAEDSNGVRTQASGRDHGVMGHQGGASAQDHAGHAGADAMPDDPGTAETDVGDEHAGHAEARADGAAEGESPAASSDEPAVTAKTAVAAGATYVCPMHKNVTSDKPGKCPKCKMKLKAKKPGSAGGASSSPSAADPTATTEPASAGAGDTAASEATEGDNAQDAHEGHDMDGGNK